MDDDGGPSYWWRDKRVKILQDKLQQNNVALSMQHKLLETVGVLEPEILERFENFVEKRPVGSLESSEVLLDQFSRSEDRRRLGTKLLKWSQAVPLAVSGALSFRYLLETPHEWQHYLVWAITILALPLAARAFVMRDGQYLGEEELKELRASKEASS